MIQKHNNLSRKVEKNNINFITELNLIFIYNLYTNCITMDYYHEERMINQNDYIVFKTSAQKYINYNEATIVSVSKSKNEIQVRLEPTWTIINIPIEHDKFIVYPCEQSLQILVQYYEKNGEISKSKKVREKILENSLWNIKKEYESFENLDKNGPPPMPDFHDNVGWQEANFEGYIDVMYEELEHFRYRMNVLYKKTIGTSIQSEFKLFFLKILKNNSKNWCSREITPIDLHKLRYLNLTV